ncbi:MAG TPA: LysM peptidoglycan-binding domain-containing protein [Deltaproteobacteria bacterium]|nr:LysM peptidoglycan-binding domain-containing protein [Deltaproteobacteria bacterium]HPR52471.1 LysM peptidoglycan-binding domain-containing protein [Deltaproteobacteria bacterium]
MKKAGTFLIVAMILFPLSGFAEDITLVKRAKRVESLQSTPYKVQEGDTLWKIFLKDFEAKSEDMPYLYKQFRELNPRIKDLNHIRAGQKVIIPRMPQQGQEMSVKAASPEVFVMKRGQHLAMVLREIYGLPDRLIFNEYLNLIKELNPEIEDLNHVEPGQKIKMPRMDEVIGAAKRAEKQVVAVKTDEQQEPEESKEETISPGEKEISTVQKEPLEEEPETSEVVIVESPEIQEDLKPEETKEVEVAPVEPEKIKEMPVEKAARVEREVSQPAPQVAQQEAQTQAPVVKESRGEDEKKQRATRLVRNTLMPALTQMGGSRKDEGTYFMPMAGGSSISIDASEIPVMELDTGRRVILDVNNKISPEVKDLLEKTFPACRIISGPVNDLEEVMDQVLSVSGYFSINKDPGPLLVGEEEKVRFFGKWIVYKDYSRHNVFVVNILSDKDKRTPKTIQDYASRFGIDLIELGGEETDSVPQGKDLVKKLDHSYTALFDELGVSYDTDKVLDLISLDALKITYKAPLLVNRVVFTDDLPDDTMSDLLKQKGYRVIHTKSTTLKEVLDAVEVAPEGPPVRITVAQSRSELELPALKVGDSIILERGIDRDIANYLVSQGSHILAW